MRIKGTAAFSQQFEVSATAPLDARMLVPTKDDLTTSGNFSSAYPGMVVAVANENKVYILKALPYTTASNWRQVGSGANTVVSGSGRFDANSYDEIFTGMIVTDSYTGDVFVYTGSDSAGIDTESNWHKVGDDSGTIGTLSGNVTALSGDVSRIAELNTVKENITAWDDDTTNSKLTGGKLRTYSMQNDTTAEVSGAAIQIPYAATDKAGVMSSTDKKAVNALTDSTNGILTYSNSAYTVNTISNADIENICNPSAQSGS